MKVCTSHGDGVDEGVGVHPLGFMKGWVFIPWGL